MTPVRWTAAALAILAVAVYANAANNGFALDDAFIIENNPRAHGIHQLDQAVSQPYWPNSPDRLALFRPLTVASYALEWEIWGANPRPFHVTNILLHALVTVLVFALLLTLLGHGPPGPQAAALGAAVFAVHPVHTEAVANVVGRAELLAAVFVLGAILVYLRGDLLRSRRRLWAGAVAMGVAYFLGLASKEIAVTLPGLLLVLELVRPAGPGPGEADVGVGLGSGDGDYGARVWARWPIYGVLAGALGLYVALRSAVLGTVVGNDAAPFFEAMGSGARVLTAVSLWPEYLRLLLLPVELVADYSPGVLMPVSAFGPRVFLGVLVAVLLVLVATWSWRRERTVAAGILFLPVAIFPVSNLVIPIGVLLAERTLYLPSVGLAVAVAGGWRWLAVARPGWRRPATGVLAALVVAGGVRTALRVPVWRSTETVLNSLTQNHPESFRSIWREADGLFADGRTTEALSLYARAVQLQPTHYSLRIQYALALLRAGRLEEAIAGFRVARQAVPELPNGHVFLMVALLEAGRPDEAVTAGRQALDWVPDHRGIHHQLAIALARTGRYAEALEAREESIRLAGPRASPLQYVHLAELTLRADAAGAAEALSRAREIATDSAVVPTLSALQEAIITADSAALPYR